MIFDLFKKKASNANAQDQIPCPNVVERDFRTGFAGDNKSGHFLIGVRDRVQWKMINVQIATDDLERRTVKYIPYKAEEKFNLLDMFEEFYLWEQSNKVSDLFIDINDFKNIASFQDYAASQDIIFDAINGKAYPAKNQLEYPNVSFDVESINKAQDTIFKNMIVREFGLTRLFNEVTPRFQDNIQDNISFRSEFFTFKDEIQYIVAHINDKETYDIYQYFYRNIVDKATVRHQPLYEKIDFIQALSHVSQWNAMASMPDTGFTKTQEKINLPNVHSIALFKNVAKDNDILFDTEKHEAYHYSNRNIQKPLLLNDIQLIENPPLKIGKYVKDKGIYMGIWKAKNEDGKSLNRTFNLYAAPEDLPKRLTFDNAIDYVSELDNYFGYRGLAIENQYELYKIVEKSPEKLSNWFIPTIEILNGTDTHGRQAQSPNFRMLHDTGDFKETFNLHDNNWYWSITRKNDQAANTSMLSASCDWNNIYYIDSSVRLVRAELRY